VTSEGGVGKSRKFTSKGEMSDVSDKEEDLERKSIIKEEF